MASGALARVAHGPVAVTVGPDGAADFRDDEGVAVAGRRVLGRYRWRWWPADAAPPTSSVRMDGGALRVSEVEDGGLRLERYLAAAGGGLRDRLVFHNDGAARRALTLELAVAAAPGAAEPVLDVAEPAWTLDGAPPVRVRLDALAAAHPDGADWELSLAPGEAVEVGAVLEVAPPSTDPSGTAR